MNEDLTRVLVAIAQLPRTIRHFTHGEKGKQLHPEAMTRRLNRLIDEGYVYQDGDVYHITLQGRKKLDIKNIAASRAMPVKSIYKSGDGEFGERYYRPGSDHSHIKSKGQSC